MLLNITGKAKKTVLALGTSEVVEKQNNTYHLFPKLVANKLYNDYGITIDFINKGISNTTTSDCLNNMTWWSKIKPDIIIYGAIGNDCVIDKPDGQGGYTERVTVNQMLSNLQTIYNKFLEILQPNGVIVICMPWYVNPAAHVRTNHAAYRTALVNFCGGQNTQNAIINMADFRTAWGADEYGAYTYDGEHPNTAGSNLLLPIIFSFVESWL